MAPEEEVGREHKGKASVGWHSGRGTEGAEPQSRPSSTHESSPGADRPGEGERLCLRVRNKGV